MKVCLSQVNPTVADLRGNLAIIESEILFASQQDCDVVLLPELVTTAYPPRDYLYQAWIWEAHEEIANRLLKFVKNLKRQITVIYGGLHQVTLTYGDVDRYNAAYIVDPIGGIRITHKRLLPQYDVFDETRYFKSGVNEPYRPIDIHIQGKRGLYKVYCDLLICEDIWNNRHNGESRLFPGGYDVDPIDKCRGEGPLFVLNGSPFWEGKIKSTKALVQDICRRIKRPVCWVNQVGAHDDIVTGGYSMVSIYDTKPPESVYNRVVTRIAKAFQEDRLMPIFADKETNHDFLGFFETGQRSGINIANEPEEQEFFGKQIDPEDFDDWCNYMACFLFAADYMRRNGFKKVVFGSSGGIDSAMIGALAAHVVGKKNVTSIGMPSEFSSEGSVADARKLAENFGFAFEVKPIGELLAGVRKQFLSGSKQRFNSPLTDENIQPRLRGLVLMAESNDSGALLWTTGNKSEVSIGYCTLYGDTCGGIAPINDLWKTEVFRMARFLNKYRGELIPVDIIDKPPSAELKPDQQDTDSLPPYEILDPLLQMIVEKDMTPEEIMKADDTLDPDVVREMYHKYKMNEYKRSQMPPGAKVQRRSFGSGRRMPISAKVTTV